VAPYRLPRRAREWRVAGGLRHALRIYDGDGDDDRHDQEGCNHRRDPSPSQRGALSCAGRAPSDCPVTHDVLQVSNAYRIGSVIAARLDPRRSPQRCWSNCERRARCRLCRSGRSHRCAHRRNRRFRDPAGDLLHPDMIGAHRVLNLRRRTRQAGDRHAALERLQILPQRRRRIALRIDVTNATVTGPFVRRARRRAWPSSAGTCRYSACSRTSARPSGRAAARASTYGHTDLLT